MAVIMNELPLSPYPSPNEETPLALPIGKSREPLTRAAVHAIIREIFDGAANWLRHTAGYHTANQQIDLRLVRDFHGT